MTLVPAVAAAGEIHTPAAAARLDDVVIAAQPDVTTIRLKTSGRPKYQAELLDSPARVVVDLEDTVFAWRPARLDADGPVRQVRGSQFKKGVARVVVELTTPANYTVRQDGDSIAIVLTPRGARVPMTALALETASTAIVDLPKPIVVAQAQRPATPPPAPPAIAPAPGTTGRLISLDFKDADVVNLLRILAAESGKNIVISDDVKGKMSITLKNVPWEQALEIILQARNLTMVERGNVIRIVTNEQLLRERDATTRLEEARVKAEESKSKAEVEVRQKAAEASVKEQEAIQKKLSIEQQLEEIRSRGPIREETIRLAYADPEDVVKTLLGILGIAQGQQLQVVPPSAGPPNPPGITTVPAAGTAPVVASTVAPASPQVSSDAASKGISIQAHKPTNSVFIRHYEKDIERIKKLVRETLDVELPLVRIEGRVITLLRTDLLEVGVQWGGAGAGQNKERVIVGQGTALAPAGLAGTSPPITPFEAPLGGRVPLTGLLPVSGITGLPLGGNLVNLPLTSGAPAGGINFGIIGTRFNINLAIQALESKTKTRVLARPEIVVTDNTKATISRGTEIGFLTGTATAGFSVAFKEAVLKLDVTPTVIREPTGTKIKMKVMLENNAPGGLIAGVPSISRQTTETQVVVKEGETLVIGGVTQRADTETITKVPLFGDIPFLGWLFKRRAVLTTPDDELAVFITPTVLKTSEAAKAPGR